MIESLLLRNFQKYRKFLVSFDPHITTIVGRSDLGKSTIIRGLKWVVLNQFDGPSNELARWGQKNVRGVLCVDGHEVVRRKGTENAYALDGKEFRAFGAEKVPDPIFDLLRIVEANFQNQLDSHFWFSQSAGEVSRQLNQIVNLGAIDNTLSHIATKLRSARTEVDVCDKRLTEALEQRDSLAWIVSVDTRLESIEARGERIEKRRRFIASLRSSVENIAQHTRKQKECGRIEARASEIVATGQQSIKLEKRTKRLKKLIIRLQRTQQAAKRIVKDPPDPTRLEQLAKRREKLEAIISRLNSAEKKLCQSKKEHSQTSTVLASYIGNKNCPVCGSKLKA